ncbi:hypothetical protein LB534_14940 [Mesorhizobium sp. CA18]|uniref:hypothetical protein n=1 Tax=unclassified Mesorhizobium TaxID=325217 RepID=UPI001CCA3C0C|nr:MULTISPECIES: hypothetical protein [unclassified Mesorhizobium]MBZ9737147.1 hypothetical protein [Mesorhizobium sp. CA9]MBZ9826581.1 hypothetical protein [Mesorhizobium sp. CA18]MBZ9830808.1 hypothetical protein [Mesorhizobium sp. CA2]MBZ9835516.1 hypothetical protein [Mesorhizobium sp. CA3]MBZ9875800.1 hypothetical protein [Mesorhizobium sp. Ca11]
MSDAPFLPARDVKVERAVGRFIIAWGALEREIDSAIHDLLFTTLRTGMIVTANLAMRAKLDLVHALFEMLRSEEGAVWRAISKDWEVRFDKLVNMTAKANAEARIPIVHSQPMAIKLDSGDLPIWMRMAARKGGLRGSGVTYTKSSLDKQTQTVVELIHEWAAARSHWESAIEAIRSADADGWLGRGPDSQDHLTLQLQSNHGSQKATPKPKRQKTPKRQA